MDSASTNSPEVTGKWVTVVTQEPRDCCDTDTCGNTTIYRKVWLPLPGVLLEPPAEPTA